MSKNEEGKNESLIVNKEITPREVDFSRWYLDVITAADLAEHAEAVRGCMIIKPNGYAIWENIQKLTDGMLKEIGVKNAYFPMLIPMSFLTKEKEHIEGFSPELAVVTHGGGEELAEPLVIRPTSETIIYDAFSRWIHSYRDLPFTINQWANVVRWEKRPRVFLRSTEFLWQEGHTAHRTAEEAEQYALMILNKIYKVIAEDWLAMPILVGKKSEKEKFAGAKSTFCFEALSQDGKSIQAGTSHDLADHFAKVFNVNFLDEKNETQTVFQTSWGISTRLIGSLIMVHSDDKGLILPPKIAPLQVIIVPVVNGNQDVDSAINNLVTALKEKNILYQVDNRDLRLGEKCYEWERKGVPLRIEIGPKDVAKGGAVLARRDTGEKEFYIATGSELSQQVATLLEKIQTSLFEKAKERRAAMDKIVDTWDDFKKAIEDGGYVYAHWCEDSDCEVAIKEETKANTRCLPLDAEEETGEHVCIHCGKKSKSNKRWVFAKSY